MIHNKTLAELIASVSREEYLKGCKEVSQLSLKNNGLTELTEDEIKSLSPLALEILALWQA